MVVKAILLIKIKNNIMKKVLVFTFVLMVLPLMTLAQEEGSVIKTEKEFSNWQVRLRGLIVAPNESATIEAIGGDVSISATFIPEVDFTYFFTKNIAAELILGTSKHNVNAIKTSVGDIDLGSVWLLPPTLTAQYHFTGNKLKPYLGAGVNYTVFYNAKEGTVADDVSYKNSIGFAFQVGFDLDINDNWFINIDAKKILLNTEATVNATTALGATVKADVDINPLVFGVGVGRRF